LHKAYLVKQLIDDIKQKAAACTGEKKRKKKFPQDDGMQSGEMHQETKDLILGPILDA
jgi:hypothetical protein